MLEDGALEPTKLRPWFYTEVVGERRSRGAVRLEGLALPAVEIERAHQLPPQPLAVRVLCDEGLQLDDECRRGPGVELCLDALLGRGDAQGLQALRRVLEPGLRPEVLERPAAPQAECLAQRRRRDRPLAGGRLLPRGGHESLEALGVDGQGVDRERVPRAARLDF